MRIIVLGEAGASRTYRIPQLSGVAYRFERDPNDQLIADVDPKHARFFLGHPEKFRGIGEDGKPLRARKRAAAGRDDPPLIDLGPPPPVDAKLASRRAAELSYVNPLEMSNAQMVEWARIKNIPWRSKRAISDYAEKKLGVFVEPHGQASVFAMLREVVAAERGHAQAHQGA